MLNRIDPYRLALELLEVVEQKLAKPSSRLALADVWASMSFCILSSNIRLELANSAHRAISSDPHLPSGDIPVCSLTDSFQAKLQSAGYRFHRAKAKQLARSRIELNARYGELTELLSKQDARATREYLVAHFPGIGIKQASMLLRDIGATADLAIIDVHIRRFLAGYGKDFDPSRKAQYLAAESWVGDLARTNRCSVAAMDLAIWAAMKALARHPQC